MQIEITEPQTEEEFEQYYRLRWEMLRKPHGDPYGSERDSPAEPRSGHLIAKVDGRIVGAETYAAFTARRGRLRRKRLVVRSRQTAIHPDFQRGGVASALMKEVENRARAMGAVELIGSFRADVVGWGKAMGFIERGESATLYGNVKSVSMYKPLR